MEDAVLKKEWRVVDIIEWGKDYLTRFAIDNPRLNIELILGNVLGKKRLELYLCFDRVLTADELARIKQDIIRRSKHEPLQYIIGSTEFFGIKFDLNGSCLIPRPETEILVEIVLGKLKNLGRGGLKVLDIGTGSGCIAISLAKNLDDAFVCAADVSEDALAIARKNAAVNGVQDRIVFCQGNLFEAIEDDRIFDLIVSNPPYIRADEYGLLPKEIKDFEPAAALKAGEDGLYFYRRIIEGSGMRLAPGGILAFEAGDGLQALDVEKLFEKTGLFSNISRFKDYNGIDRVITAEKNKDKS